MKLYYVAPLVTNRMDSNPYFIVQQGKLNALCVMSDTERLQLLREVTETTVYDEKKGESLNKMEEDHANNEKDK